VRGWVINLSSDVNSAASDEMLNLSSELGTFGLSTRSVLIFASRIKHGIRESLSLSFPLFVGSNQEMGK
jgi:hypothetical protein